MDEGLRQTSLPKVLMKLLRFMVEHGEPLGLKLNLSKSKLHAWGANPPVSLILNLGLYWHHISTHNSEMIPHSHYKYLGVFFSTNYDDEDIGNHICSAIDLFLLWIPGNELLH